MDRSPGLAWPASLARRAPCCLCLPALRLPPPLPLQIGLLDGRKFDSEGGREEHIDDCLLLLNKQGQPLLAHGRSGTYTDDKRIIIPMIVSNSPGGPVAALGM